MISPHDENSNIWNTNYFANNDISMYIAHDFFGPFISQIIQIETENLNDK